jgi:crotonobetainyl-CoA:carnitine CoA-transferase CaiB-like acyl-CoA transferase
LIRRANLVGQGADVVKVEALGGAAERGSARAVMSSPLFSVLNRNKRSLAIDLGSPRGVATFLKLAAGADVILQNFRPGVVQLAGAGRVILLCHFLSL